MEELTFICVGDMHIKIHKDVPLTFQQSRYRELFAKIATTCTEKGADLILAGDQLDSNLPKKEELQLFLEMLHGFEAAGITVFMVSGNHETIAKGVSILDFLEIQGFTNVYYRETVRNYKHTGVDIALVNHDGIHAERELPGPNTMLVSHFRSNMNEYVREEIDVAKFTEGYFLTIAGDIHDDLNFGDVWYTNNPINKDFERAPKCQWLEVSVTPGNYRASYRNLDLPALRLIECDIADYPPTYDQRHFYKVEVTGTSAQLRGLEDQEGRAKLVPVPTVESTLVIGSAIEPEDTTSSEEERLIHYMVEALQYPAAKVSEMVRVFKEVA